MLLCNWHTPEIKIISSYEKTVVKTQSMGRTDTLTNTNMRERERYKEKYSDFGFSTIKNKSPLLLTSQIRVQTFIRSTSFKDLFKGALRYLDRVNKANKNRIWWIYHPNFHDWVGSYKIKRKKNGNLEFISPPRLLISRGCRRQNPSPCVLVRFHLTDAHTDLSDCNEQILKTIISPNTIHFTNLTGTTRNWSVHILERHHFVENGQKLIDKHLSRSVWPRAQMRRWRQGNEWLRINEVTKEVIPSS